MCGCEDVQMCRYADVQISVIVKPVEELRYNFLHLHKFLGVNKFEIENPKFEIQKVP